MKKTLYTLLILLSGFKALAQDADPTAPKPVTVLMFQQPSDSALFASYLIGTSRYWKHLVGKSELTTVLDPKIFTGAGSSLHPITIKFDTLTHFNGLVLQNDSGAFTKTLNMYWDKSASRFNVVAPMYFASDAYFAYQMHMNYTPAGSSGDSVLVKHGGIISVVPAFPGVDTSAFIRKISLSGTPQTADFNITGNGIMGEAAVADVLTVGSAVSVGDPSAGGTGILPLSINMGGTSVPESMIITPGDILFVNKFSGSIYNYEQTINNSEVSIYSSLSTDTTHSLPIKFHTQTQVLLAPVSGHDIANKDYVLSVASGGTPNPLIQDYGIVTFSYNGGTAGIKVKADSAVLMPKANSYTLAAMQTKLNNYRLKTDSLTFDYGLNRTAHSVKSDTTVVKSKSGALTDYNNLSARITTNAGAVTTEVSRATGAEATKENLSNKVTTALNSSSTANQTDYSTTQVQLNAIKHSANNVTDSLHYARPTKGMLVITVDNVSRNIVDTLMPYLRVQNIHASLDLTTQKLRSFSYFDTEGDYSWDVLKTWVHYGNTLNVRSNNGAAFNTSMSLLEAEKQMIAARQILQSFGQNPNYFIAPSTDYDITKDTLAKKYYAAGFTRGSGDGTNSVNTVSTNPFRLTRIAAETATLSQMETALDSAGISGGMIAIYFHDLPPSTTYPSSPTFANIKALIAYAKGKTNIDIVTADEAISRLYPVLVQKSAVRQAVTQITNPYATGGENILSNSKFHHNGLKWVSDFTSVTGGTPTIAITFQDQTNYNGVASITIPTAAGANQSAYYYQDVATPTAIAYKQPITFSAMALKSSGANDIITNKSYVQLQFYNGATLVQTITGDTLQDRNGGDLQRISVTATIPDNATRIRCRLAILKTSGSTQVTTGFTMPQLEYSLSPSSYKGDLGSLTPSHFRPNLNNVQPAEGDIMFADSASVANAMQYVRLTIGTAGFVLTSVSGKPAWAVLPTTPLTQATANLAAQTTAGTVTSFPVASLNATFSINPYLNVTAIATDVIQVQITYTDQNSNAQTISLANVSAIGTANYNPITIRAKGATTITVKTNLSTSGGTVTFDAGASIVKLP